MMSNLKIEKLVHYQEVDFDDRFVSIDFTYFQLIVLMVHLENYIKIESNKDTLLYSMSELLLEKLNDAKNYIV
jgi:hypothetical protein